MISNKIICLKYKSEKNIKKDGCRRTFRNWAGERKVKFMSIKVEEEK